ncbi:major facilitator superfamily domain-containing protein [Pisolithus marmoratus]|nr:major facilitator superfamily domain-containing protein [Pisolithus marmoratus]
MTWAPRLLTLSSLLGFLLNISSARQSESAQEVNGAGPKEIENTPESESGEERRLRRKLDLRLMPVVVFVAIMNSIDQISITFARLKGLQSDLHLTDVQYDTVLAVSYALYFPALVPSNMVDHIPRGLSRRKAHNFLTKNYATVVTCRVLLGLPEASIYPGCLYLLSSWYTRKELGLRTALLITGGLMAIAFGSPRNTRWLNAEERSLAQLRLAKDVGEADVESTGASIFEDLQMVIKDMKAYLVMLMSFSVSLSTSFAVFLPTLTATLGYSTTVTLLIAAPPWVLSAIVGIANAWHSDRTGERFFHFVIYWWISIIGFVISLSTMEIVARYFSQYLMALSFSGSMLLIPWVVSAIPRPPGKRSVTIALMNGFTNLGLFAGSYVWKASWSPQYHPSLLICLFSIFSGTVFAFIIRIMQMREKKHVEHQEVDDLGQDERDRIERAAELQGITFDDAFRRRRQLQNI